MLARVTGPVLRMEAKTGTAKVSGKAYRIATATVLIDNQGVADVNLPELVEATTGVGQVVDWAVEVTVFGSNAQARWVSDWTVVETTKPLAASGAVKA